MIYALLPLAAARLDGHLPSGCGVCRVGQIDPTEDFGEVAPCVWLAPGTFDVHSRARDGADCWVGITLVAVVIAKRGDVAAIDAIILAVMERLMGWTPAGHGAALSLQGTPAEELFVLGAHEFIPIRFSTRRMLRGTE